MTKRQIIPIVFGSLQEYPKNPLSGTFEQLEFLSTFVPNSSMYFRKIHITSENYWPQVKKSSIMAFKEENKRLQLYEISDEESEIHWFAMDRKYEKYVEMLEPWVGLCGYFERFPAKDIYREEGDR